MNNILFNISGKIAPSFVDTLYQIKKISDSLDIPFFIVGATARDIILEYCHNIISPRMTKDIDLGVRVSDWEKYNTLSDALLATGNFSKTREIHRYVHNGIYVDLVPFGPIANGNRIIQWPQEHKIFMSTLGFDEAYKYAITIRLSTYPILDIKLPTIPGLAIMKLISWNEKYPERKKDAEDLIFIMKNYEYTGIETRLYGKEVSLLEEEDFDNRLAGIRLLGRDMAKISDPSTLSKIKDILDTETKVQSHYTLIANMSTFADDSDEILLMLEKMKNGVFECPSN